METAAARGMTCRGIEPDREMSTIAKAAGHDVVDGYFPQDMPSGERYDAIVFNDVFEHLPDVNGIVQTLPNYLRDGGVVIVNLPVADGLIFRLCRAAARLGVRGPLDRMWQRGLPSPHLNYFTGPTLARAFGQAGFASIRQGQLQSVAKEGLYERIRYDRAVGPARATAMYAAARVARAMTGFFPSDIQYFVFQRPAP
jgi:SAM-dependent methyltransferase